MSGEDRSRGRSVAEWSVFTVACVVVLAVVAVLAATLVGPREPPAFTVEPTQVTTRSGASFVTVRVTNTGDRTAADIQVDATLTRPGAPPQTATQTLEFLSGQESREVVFVFEQDVRAEELQTRVAAFRVP